MAEIGVKRLRAGDHEEDETERHQPDRSVRIEKRHRIGRIDGGEHARIIVNMQHAGGSNTDEPDHHDRGEETRDPRGSSALSREQGEENGNGQRCDVVVERGSDQRQSFDRRQHGNGGRDHRVAQEHGSADNAEQEHDCGTPPQCTCRQRRQGQRAALPAVIGP